MNNSILENSNTYKTKERERVEVNVKPAGDEIAHNGIALCFADGGPGVAPEAIKKLFSEFYRTDPSRDKKGAGLSLAISARLIERTGGACRAELPPSGGLTITDSLPLVKEGAVMPEKPRILIIEDDKDIAGIEKDFLEINGFEAVVESNGVKGKERALAGGFALVPLDLMLPGKDGMTICREIREKIDVPILMVTARVEDIDKVHGLGLGAGDYVTKPFSPTELVARVKSHIACFKRLTRNAGPGKKPDGIDFGWLKINHETRRIFLNDREIMFTHKEYELLYFLAANEEVVFSKEQSCEIYFGLFLIKY